MKEVSVKDLKVGDTLINLGQVLEIEEKTEHFFLVISRNNEKQVFKFSSDVNLMILS